MTHDPGQTSLASVHHDGSGRYVLGLHGVSPDRLSIGDEVRLRVRAAPTAPVERIILRTVPDGEQRFTELIAGRPDAACRWWEATLRVTMPVTGYRFLIVLASGGHRWLNGSGVHEATPTDRDDFLILTGYDAPSWVHDRVFYQIFPDRFANADPANDVRDGAWTYRGHAARHAPWDTLPGTDPGSAVEFFGGDLAGIEGRLDHLVDLGVNGLYLTPIFATRSNHGYDIVDYDHVADHVGGDLALASLRRATRDRGIRLLLDIAPNHVGAEHPWFRAAQADPTAPTASYFLFHERPDTYESWLGVASLPKLDYRSPDLRIAMYEGEGAVLRRWLRPPFAIDGWRIDVANMLGRLGPDQLGADVARGMRAAIRAEAPEAYLVGEHWFDAIDQLAGDQWDGVMNYAGFTTPVLQWLTRTVYRAHGSGTVLHVERSSTDAMLTTLTAFRAAIAWSVATHQFNLVGSHDTARIRTVLDGDTDRVRAAMGFLLTYVGVPSLFYGDEIGVEASDDRGARRTMPWDRTTWDDELHSFVRRLVRFRVGSAALRRGGFQVLEVGDSWLAYQRDSDEELVIAVIVRGPASRPTGPLPVAHGAVADGTTFEELFTGARSSVAGGMLPLPSTPTGVAVWTTSGH